jgi:hypothetical protein
MDCSRSTASAARDRDGAERTHNHHSYLTPLGFLFKHHLLRVDVGGNAIAPGLHQGVLNQSD